MQSSPSRKLRLIPAASSEYQASIRWYMNKSLDTALRFKEQVERTLDQVRRDPFLFAEVYHDRRRALLDIFPYQVIYVVRPDIVLVLSIARSNRNPARWQYRLLPHERE